MVDKQSGTDKFQVENEMIQESEQNENSNSKFSNNKELVHPSQFFRYDHRQTIGRPD